MRLRRVRSGETIVEILIAVFVLVTTGTAASGLLVQSNRTNYDIKQSFQAKYLAREVLENLKMLRDTNWIRFSDRTCWDLAFEEKDCEKTSPERILELDQKKNFALVTGKPANMYFHFVQQIDSSGADSFKICMEFDGRIKTKYDVYRNETSNPDDPYEGILYSTDETPPAGSVPVLCRKVTLTKESVDSIRADVMIGWKVGSKGKIVTTTDYIQNN